VLLALELKDFAIIDELKVAFAPGLNVLTGETGAGKSILVDALTLLIGGRADARAVRTGAKSALIQGFFSGEDAPEVLARRLQSSGRSTARLDGELVTVGELALTGARLVAIHGQHASQTLLESAEQRRLLDRLLSSKSQEALGRYGERYRAFTARSRELAELRERVRERARRLDILSFQVDEIDRAKLQPGEEARLQEALESLRHAERIVQGAGSALHHLSEGEVSAVDLLGSALRDLEAAGRYHPALRTLAGELQDALMSVQATSAEVADFLSSFEAGAGELEALERRLSLIETLKLKYGDTVEAILAFREEAGRELGALQNAESDMSRLEAEREALERELTDLAAQLSAARQGAAARLSQEVTQQLRPLGMANAQFIAEVAPTDGFTPSGKDAVTFFFSANLGEPPAPLAAVASGGELSRVMLALNVVTGSDLPTLTFDEVDAGLGGATARAVGGLLKRLAGEHQVLVVTHLPQVAAFADAHFRVEKLETDGRTVTRVTQLSGEAREAELARMLSGAVTPTALAHARELLKGASLEAASP